MMNKLIEAFKMKCVQLQQAIRHGDDELVSELDREIEPLMQRIVKVRAETVSDMRQQLLLVCDILRDNAADKAAVLRNTALMTVLLNRYLLASGGGSMLETMSGGMPVSLLDPDAADEPTFAEAMIDSLADPVMAVTRDHHVLYANKLAAEANSVRPVDMIGAHVSAFLAPGRYIGAIAPAIDSCIDNPDLVLQLPEKRVLTIVHAVVKDGRQGAEKPQAVLLTQRRVASR